SRAVRLRARPRITARARDARTAGPTPGQAAAFPGAGLPRVVAQSHQGAPGPPTLRLADAGARSRALPGAQTGGRTEPRACAARPRPAWRRVLFRRPAALSGAALPGERALGEPSRRARLQLRRR